MRKILLAATALLFTATTASAESLAGFWLSAEGRSGGCALVEFTKTDGAYNGQIVAIIENENKESVGNLMFTDLKPKRAKAGAIETYGGGKAYAPDEPEKSYPFGHAHLVSEDKAFMGAGNCNNRMEVVDEAACRIGVFVRGTASSKACL